jgi:hypothetical protein
MALEEIKDSETEGRGGDIAVDGTADRRVDRGLWRAQSIVEGEEDRRGYIVM